MEEQCFICGEQNENVLQEHHIVPRRHGGSNNSENIAKLCSNCHQAVERLYNKRFYRKLGVLGKGERYKQLQKLKTVFGNIQDTFKENYTETVGEFPETNEIGRVTEAVEESFGIGEQAGYYLGAHAAACEFYDFIEEKYGVE